MRAVFLVHYSERSCVTISPKTLMHLTPKILWYFTFLGVKHQKLKCLLFDFWCWTQKNGNVDKTKRDSALTTETFWRDTNPADLHLNNDHCCPWPLQRCAPVRIPDIHDRKIARDLGTDWSIISPKIAGFYFIWHDVIICGYSDP